MLMETTDTGYLYRYGSSRAVCWSYYKQSFKLLEYLDNKITDLTTWITVTDCTRNYYEYNSIDEFFQNHPELLI